MVYTEGEFSLPSGKSFMSEIFPRSRYHVNACAIPSHSKRAGKMNEPEKNECH